MPQRPVWSVAMILLCPLLLLAAPGYAGASVDGDGQRARLAQLQERIQHILNELQSSQARQQALQQELQKMERRIAESARSLHLLGQRLDRQKQQLAELEAQRRLQRQQLSRQRRLLADQLLAAYAMGRQQRLKILLNQQEPGMVSRILVYYDYLNQARMALVEQAGEMLERLQQTEAAIRDEQQRSLELQARERQEKQLLESARELRLQLVAALDQEIRSKSEALKRTQQDAQRLQQLIERLRERRLPPELALEDGARKRFRALKGKYDWPVKGRLIARFGTRKAGNLKWDGVMISAPEGRTVRAIQGGRVAFADWLRGFGLLLIIDHGDGYMTLYGNNQSLFRETGEWVEAGEPVALVGSSGGHSNSGLYFGIRHNGRAVNPIKWCRRIRGNRIGMDMEQPVPGTERDSSSGVDRVAYLLSKDAVSNL